MQSLAQLALKYRCDKLLRHSYIPIYAKLLEGMDVKSLLEIGIGTKELMEPFVPDYVPGASLFMWRDFFPEANIYACDIVEEVLINEGRIRSFRCDQGSREDLEGMLKNIGEKLDVVVDDGSHLTNHQVFTATVLLPWVKVGGLYVIEDVQEPLRVSAAVRGEVVKGGRTADDNLVVVRKK